MKKDLLLHLPSRSRPDLLEHTIQTVYASCYSKDNFDILCQIDSDEYELYKPLINKYPEIKSWDEIEMNECILRGIYSYGYEKPSPIQQKAILPIIAGKDVIAQAQSGTGKTAAFAVGSLSIINTNENFTQVLILSPTKELTLQTANVIKNICQQATK